MSDESERDRLRRLAEEERLRQRMRRGNGDAVDRILHEALDPKETTRKENKKADDDLSDFLADFGLTRKEFSDALAAGDEEHTEAYAAGQTYAALIGQGRDKKAEKFLKKNRKEIEKMARIAKNEKNKGCAVVAVALVASIVTLAVSVVYGSVELIALAVR